jgi:hypothetical protein
VKSIMDQVKEEEQREFLKLAPLERMELMHDIFMQIVSIKAKSEGVSEYEIYTRHLKDDPERIGRDRKLERLLSPPPDEEVRERPEEYI